MTTAIPTPSIEYGVLSPILIVLGVAVAGVLVEAFAPTHKILTWDYRGLFQSGSPPTLKGLALPKSEYEGSLFAASAKAASAEAHTRLASAPGA